MTNTPLNPDALEDAADVIWMRANVEHGVCRADRERGSYRIAADAAEEAISAYLAVAQPVVNSFDPRELNRYGWTCGCEPGDYDKCEGCQTACDELADFLNRLEVNK